MIRFEEVTITAGAVTVLDRLSLSFSAGEPTVLIGPNGAGKSTVLRAAMGLLQPTAGRIVWDSEPRRAIVFQRPVLLDWRSDLGEIRIECARSERGRRR